MADIKINTDSLKASRQWVRHKVKDGTNTYRILPPFGEESNGYPYRKWSLIWSLNDPESGRMRPYVSSLAADKKCPVTELVDGLQALSKEKTAKLEAQGAGKDQIKNANEKLNKLISELRPKTVFLYNACDQSGSVGILEVKTTAHKKLKTLMMNYINDYGQDPTSLSSTEEDSGVWFNFVRSGSGFDTEYDVSKKQTQTKINGQLAFVDDRSPLPENVVQNYENLAYDIHGLYEHKTYDELKAILLANLKDIGQKCPEALLVAEKLGLLTGGLAVQTVEKTETAQTPAPAAKKVALNLGSDDEDGLEEEQVVHSTAANDDILAMADDILNS